MHYRLVCLGTKAFLKIFCQFEVVGRENFPSRGQPFIFASNHVSYLDPPILAVISPHKLGFLAKEELFKNKIFGFIIRSLGAIPLDRDATDVRAVRAALKILKTKPLAVFPQGTRGRTLDEFTNGVGFLCKKTQVPVIVARIHGAQNVLPPNAKFFRPAKIKVVIDQVRDIKPDDDYKQITAKIMAKIKSL